MSEEIRRLPKKDQFLGCAPSQSDEGVSEAEVGLGWEVGGLGECRMAESTGSVVRRTYTQVPAPSLASSVTWFLAYKMQVASHAAQCCSGMKQGRAHSMPSLAPVFVGNS